MSKSFRKSPPWVTMWNEINSSVGNDKSVKVAELDDSGSPPYYVYLTVKQAKKAVALASILKSSHDCGGVTLLVQVKEAQGAVVAPVVPTSTGQLSRLIRDAMAGNAWFRTVVGRRVAGSDRVFAVFARGVVQFYDDDLSDLYGNYNNVAAFVFSEVLEPAPGGLDLRCATAKT